MVSGLSDVWGLRDCVDISDAGSSPASSVSRSLSLEPRTAAVAHSSCSCSCSRQGSSADPRCSQCELVPDAQQTGGFIVPAGTSATARPPPDLRFELIAVSSAVTFCHAATVFAKSRQLAPNAASADDVGAKSPKSCVLSCATIAPLRARKFGGPPDRRVLARDHRRRSDDRVELRGEPVDDRCTVSRVCWPRPEGCRAAPAPCDGLRTTRRFLARASSAARAAPRSPRPSPASADRA